MTDPIPFPAGAAHYTSFDELKGVVDVMHQQRERMERFKIYIFALGQYTAVFATGEEAQLLQAYVVSRQEAKMVPS